MRERNKNQYLKQQGLKRASIKHEDGKLVFDTEKATWTIHMPDGPGTIVADLAKDEMPDEVARIVQQFEEAGLPPTGVVYDPSGLSDDEDDATGDTAEGV